MPVLILRYDTGNRGIGNATAPGGQQNEWSTNPAETFPAVQKVWREMKSGLNGAHIGQLAGYWEGLGGALCATGFITFASTITGSVGAVINGVTVTVTALTAASGNNYVSATALLWLAAFRNVLTAGIPGYVLAKLDPYNVGDETGDFTARILLSAWLPGTGYSPTAGFGSGNFVTLVASGTGVTVSGATLTGGVSDTTTVLPLIDPVPYFPATG